MAKAALHERQQELLQAERRLASELQECLSGFAGAEVQTETLRQVQEQFQRELRSSMQRVRESIAPYTRFVRTEQKRVEMSQTHLNEIGQGIADLRTDIEGSSASKEMPEQAEQEEDMAYHHAAVEPRQHYQGL